jgi:hypothetical protein
MINGVADAVVFKVNDPANLGRVQIHLSVGTRISQRCSQPPTHWEVVAISRRARRLGRFTRQ